MAAAVRSTSSIAYASRTNTTVTAPAGIQDGDILLVFFLVGTVGGSPSPGFPAGFADVAGPTFVDDDFFYLNYYCMWKRASGESGNYTFTHGANSSAAYMYCISGGKISGSPINASSSNSGQFGPSSTATGITTTVNSCLVVFGMHDWGDTTNNLTPPTGSTPTFTEREDSAILYYADGTLATAGATGNKSMTSNSLSSGGGGHPWGAYLVAIEPAAGASSRPLFRQPRRFITGRR